MDRCGLGGRTYQAAFGQIFVPAKHRDSEFVAPAKPTGFLVALADTLGLMCLGVLGSF